MNLLDDKSYQGKSTIHTSRTIMFAEISRLMDFYHSGVDFNSVFSENYLNKLTKANQKNTAKYLKQLYGLDLKDDFFKCLIHFWKLADEKNKRIISLLYAIGRDQLLLESIDVVKKIAPGKKVSIDFFIENIENKNPKRFSEKTRLSTAQNIASSWKQAGYIVGKIKNIRWDVKPGYVSVAFALLSAFLKGDRGEYLMQSKWVQVLDVSEMELRELAYEASKHDLLMFQYSGGVTKINFDHLLQKLNIHVVKN